VRNFLYLSDATLQKCHFFAQMSSRASPREDVKGAGEEHCEHYLSLAIRSDNLLFDELRGSSPFSQASAPAWLRFISVSQTSSMCHSSMVARFCGTNPLHFLAMFHDLPVAPGRAMSNKPLLHPVSYPRCVVETTQPS